LSKDFRLTEKLAMAMPIGLGLTTFIMFFLDRTIHSITAGNVDLCVGMLAVIMLVARTYLDWRANDLPWRRPRPTLDLSWLTLAWVVFAGMSAYLVYGITVKCLYWPTAEFDAILGYDLLAKAIAREHVITNSILGNKNIVLSCATRMLYPPLVALSNSLCYMTGMETSKPITAMFYISWVFSFYLLLRRFVTATNAIIFTFMVIMIPEMFAHASFSLSNLPCAIYSTIGAVSFVIWFEQKKEGFFYLSLLGIIFSMWTRSETIVFLGAILVVLLYIAVVERRFKYVLIYALAIVPFQMWNMFLKAYVPRAQGEFFNKTISYNSGKMAQILKTAKELMTRSDLYGVTFELFALVAIAGIVINIVLDFKRNKWLIGGLALWIIMAMAGGLNIFSLAVISAVLLVSCYINQDHWVLIALFLGALAGYTAIFYQVSDADTSLFAPGGWMQSGYKRGLFCYAPLAVFYVASSKWMTWAFAKLDERLVLFTKKA
jgi:hypothetical protein